MNFDWKSYLALAAELIEHQRTPELQPAYFRTSISRSYYGVFCIARNLLIQGGVTIPNQDVHKFVREHFQNSPYRVDKKIGEHLSRLWWARKAADYKDDFSVDKMGAETSHQIADRTLKLFRT